MPLSRRRFFETLLAVAYAAPNLFAAHTTEPNAPALPVDGLRSQISGPPERILEQDYRVDATILFLSFPLFTRTDAGGGYATIEERKQDDGAILSLEFAAGSNPERARGLNRLGFFQEIVVENPGSKKQAAYFGFMTSSPEDSLDAGKQALEDGEGDSTVYDAIAGHIGEGREQSRRSFLDISNTLEWDRFRQLAGQVEQGLRTSETAKEKQQATGPEVGTFLHSVMDSAWSGCQKCERLYSYNGKKYRLETEREDDPKTAERLLTDGVIGAEEKLVLLRGRIVNLETNKDSKFRLWITDSKGQQLPVRFEYKPRSFLRIAFEAKPANAPVSHKTKTTAG